MITMRMVMLTCLIWLVLSLTGSLKAEILSSAEQGQLTDMLRSAGYDSSDVTFFKDWDATSKFKLTAQVNSLNNPWEFINWLDEMKQTLRESFTDLPDSLRRKPLLSHQSLFTEQLAPQLDAKITHYTIPVDSAPKFSWNDITRPKDLFAWATQAFRRLEQEQQAAFSRLTPAQLDTLSLWMHMAWQEGEDSLAYKYYYQKQFPGIGQDISMQTGIRLLELVDFDALCSAMNDFEVSCRSLEEQVSRLKFTHKKPIYHQSPWGTMIIGGTGNDRYANSGKLKDSPPCLIIEPSGNDIYECALFADRKHPFYIVLDVQGGDIYQYREIAKQQSVTMGSGYLHDYDGNDIYKGYDFAFSALLGFQALIDDKGDEIYTSGLFTQAASMFGISILNDKSGSDSYSATEFAQGLGGTKGFGLLLDGSGNDVYYTGGKYLHTPLAPFDYRSMAQGFGFGMRSDLAGGIGVLYDGSGNDRYSGGVYAQGVAYWYAIGALIDEKGNDYYDAVYYPQGSGIHLANGALIDMDGEDHYYSKHGPGQGNGHDWSVGVFVDKKGNDQYSIEGGNGLGLTNSVGIFVDCQGDDKYENKSTSNYGYANAARETAGLGLFLDAGGKDAYPDSTKAENKTWQQGTYGIGRDIDMNKPEQTRMQELAATVSATVDSLAAISEIFAIACEWEVGSAVERVKLAREVMLRREAEAVPYVLQNQMASKEGLVYRALEVLTQKSKLMQSSLYSVLHDPDSLAVKNAMSLLTTVPDSTAIDSLAVFLQAKKYIPTVISCLGAYKTQRSLDLIQPWLTHPSEKYRYIAARSLKTMNTPASLAILKTMANDRSFLIKAMVRQLKS